MVIYIKGRFKGYLFFVIRVELDLECNELRQYVFKMDFKKSYIE